MSNVSNEGVVIPIGTAPLGPPPRVLAVVGGKGGVGRSTIAANLATHWASEGYRVVLVDGTPGNADLNLLFGVAPTRSILDLFEGPVAPLSIEDVLVGVEVGSGRVSLLPGLNGSFKAANLVLRHRQHLVNELESLHDQFDTLIIDGPAGITNEMGVWASLAECMLVVTSNIAVSVGDSYGLIKVLSSYGRHRRFLLAENRPSPVSVANVPPAHTRLEKPLVKRFLGDDVEVVDLGIVHFHPEIMAAGETGRPVVLESPGSEGAKAFYQLARAIRQNQVPDRRTYGLWLPKR